MATAARREVIGRDRELAQLEGFLSSLPTGPGALVLAGEPGIGKTTLWRAGVETARERSLRVLSARPVEAEAKLSYTAVGDLLEPVLGDVLPGLPTPQRRALEAALLLRESYGPVDQRAVAVGVLTAVRTLTAAGPLVVAIDDVQWLDAASESALCFLVRRLGAEPVGLLLSQRIAAPGAAPLELDRALPTERLDSLWVGPLSLGALHRLVHERLGGALPRPLLVRLHQASGGNPFFALEIARALESADARAASGEPLPVPASLEELVCRRLASLPAHTRSTLLFAAALSGPTLGRVAAASSPEAEVRLRPALRARVVELDGERIRFGHPLLAASAYNGATAEERRAVHARLAAVVPDLEQRARHLALAAAGPDSAVARELDWAARRAAQRGAPSAGAELAELAAGLTPEDDVDDRRRRLIDAAEQHHTAGQIARARTIVEALVNDLPPGPERARALFQLGWTEYDWRRVTELCEQALAETRANDPLRGMIHHWLAVLWVVRGDLGRATWHAREAVALAEKTADPVALVRSLSAHMLVDTLAARPVPEARMAHAIELEDTVGGVPLYYPPSLVHAIRLMYRDRLDEARQRYERALRFVADRGDEEMVCAVTFHMAQLECRAGRWPTAADHAARGYELCQALGLEEREGVLRYTQAMVAAHQGRVAEARAFGSEALAIVEGAGDSSWTVEAQTWLGFLELSLGEFEAAARWLRPLPGRLWAMGYREPSHYQAIPNLVEALVGLGKPGEARPLVARFGRLAGAVDSPLARAQAARCRGLVASGDGDLEGALTELVAALAEHERAPVPFERARSLFVLGSLRRRAKRKAAAREALSEALAVFERLGARLWAGKARAEIGSIGGRAPTAGELTATERRVADLVASGHTNREVAGALVVSQRTVESHLSHIYRKLGLRSRTELARHLAATTEMRGEPSKVP